ncbi:hypothetical protein B4N84_23000 [Flavobacterium sp. IR1]|nr:hypothetical protein B4N84_23000 [Flavobacterium sp. IR1]
MAYIQFLSEQLESKEEIFMCIINSAYNVKNISTIYFRGYNKEINITKNYVFNEEKIEESINGISDCIDLYNEYVKFNEEERFIISNLIERKKLIPLFSAEKVRSKKLLFEFAIEYLKIRPNNYLLIDETDLYDLYRLEKMI